MNQRRKFLGAAGAGTLAAAMPWAASAATPKVVVVGGGMAGAAAAKFLRLWSGRTIDVTLVVPSTTYISNIMSNLVVTGQVAYGTLKFTYEKLKSLYGVKVVPGTVTTLSGFGATAGTVRVVNGPSTTDLPADRVILAPGIEMDPVQLTGGAIGAEAPALHAWQAGQQTLDLQSLLVGMQGGQTFVMTIPAKPYRCPPGPYERACVVADYLKRNKPGAKVVVLDANTAITAEPENFGRAFQDYNLAGVLEYWPNTKVVSASAGAAAGKGQTLTIDVGTSSGLLMPVGIAGTGVRTLFAHVANVIPAHRAPKVVRDAGLVPAGARYAPVNPLTFESTLRGRVHVLGDAADTTLPKAGHVGNQGAKICAAAVVNAFKNLPPDPAPTANSACFSPIDSTRASWLTAVYQINPATGKMAIYDDMAGGFNGGPGGTPTPATEAAAPSTKNFSMMNTWYKVLMSDTFA